MNYSIRKVQQKDSAAWKRLYHSYRGFYEAEHDTEVVDRTFEWLVNKEFGLTGIVAVDKNDQPVGLANLRVFVRPDTADFGLYLDDLFVDENHRSQGIARGLLTAAKEVAVAKNANGVAWITADDNKTARSLYDTLATATKWVTYEMDVDA